jgi:hypothetical protein
MSRPVSADDKAVGRAAAYCRVAIGNSTPHRLSALSLYGCYNAEINYFLGLQDETGKLKLG